MNRAGRVAWLLAAASTALALVILIGFCDRARSFADHAFPILFVPFVLVGALIASRRPGNAIGWLFVGSPTATMVGVVTAMALEAHLTDPVWGTLAMAISLLALAVVNVGFGVLLTFLLFLFPDGHLPSPRWRPAAWATVSVLALTALTQLFTEETMLTGYPNPLATWEPGAVPRAILPVATGVLFPAAVTAALAALAVRYRRSRGIERLQLRWFLFVAALIIATFLVSELVPVGRPAMDVVGPLVFAALPITVALAILRHRLYDIDVLIRRTLVYGALSVTLAGVYWGSVIVLQALLSPFVGADTFAVAASTLAVAVLFQPARARIKTAVDRRFYRSRYDATQTVEGFGARLRNEVDVSRLTGNLAEVVADSLQPASISIWLRGGPR